MRSRLLAVLSTLAVFAAVLTVGSPAASALDGPPPVISEVMFNTSASPEGPWEWIELYNPGTEALDLSGWVVDDINSIAVAAPNIASGTIPAGGSAVLFNADDNTAANFEAAWGSGINLIAVTGWSAMALNNGGDTIGFWEDAASHAGDQATHANAVLSVAYNGSIDDGVGSIHLSNLADQSSWTLSVDGLATPVGATITAAAAGGNPGTDIGSPTGTPTPPAPGELVFTQYVEGSGFNKAIEIGNVGAGSVSLDGYVLELYSNGSPTPSTSSALTGSVAGGEVVVFVNSSTVPPLSDLADGVLAAVNWNGDDAVVLRDPDGVVVDSIGQVGFDPGSAWSAGGVSTANNTMCRDSAAPVGDTDPSDVFDPSVGWISLGNNNFAGIGVIGCEDVNPPGSDAKIHEVQGSGSQAALLGTTVTVQAVVTSLFEDDDALDGFFIQEEDADADGDPATSEGLFVFCDGAGCPGALAVGDLVTVNGVVEEFFGMSQIDTGTGSVVIDSSGNPLPTAVAVDLPASGATNAEGTFENLEGMLVTFTDKLVVSEYFQLARFGQLVLTADARPEQFTDANMPSAAGYSAFLADLAATRIILDDNNNDQNDATFGPDNNELYPHPDGGFATTNLFRGGDSITGLTGVLHWSWAGSSGTDAWRIRKTVGPDYSFASENQRPATPAAVGGSLTVASFNVLNYFTTITEPGATCGPSNLGCRGAHSVAELDRQRDKIVSALSVMNADIVGLIEIENDSGASVADLVAGLNAQLGAGTYDYVDTGTIGGDAIKVALIYKPSTVSTVGDFAILDSSVDPTFVDDKNRPVLIQTFEETASGERVTIAVNHLKSKGSDCDDLGDPDLNDGQANCNLTRTAAATALANYLATDPTGSGDPDALIIGDLNAYAMEDPITALTGAGYADLVAQFGGSGAYSFVFDGQLGYLDHALANQALLPQIAGASVWHINADEVNLLDYNDDIQDPSEASFQRESSGADLYDPDQYRSSDHDPVLVGLNLGPTCNGLLATIIGTDGSDNLVGTGGDDVIVGLGSADVIDGRGGDDVICAGDGKDRVVAGSGDDIVFGEGGRDSISGQGGNDFIDGGGDNDTIEGGPGSDQLLGGDGMDIIRGDSGEDVINGGAGKDKLFGNGDDDTINGGDDNDTIKGDAGRDILAGDGGDDTVLGGSGDDSLDGGDGSDTLRGNSGTDTCTTGENVRTCEL